MLSFQSVYFTLIRTFYSLTYENVGTRHTNNAAKVSRILFVTYLCIFYPKYIFTTFINHVLAYYLQKWRMLGKYHTQNSQLGVYFVVIVPIVLFCVNAKPDTTEFVQTTAAVTDCIILPRLQVMFCSIRLVLIMTSAIRLNTISANCWL